MASLFLPSPIPFLLSSFIITCVPTPFFSLFLSAGDLQTLCCSVLGFSISLNSFFLFLFFVYFSYECPTADSLCFHIIYFPVSLHPSYLLTFSCRLFAFCCYVLHSLHSFSYLPCSIASIWLLSISSSFPFTLPLLLGSSLYIPLCKVICIMYL